MGQGSAAGVFGVRLLTVVALSGVVGPLHAAPTAQGFRAVIQTRTGDEAPVDGRLDYGHHHLRLDRASTTALIDLRNGTFTLINHARKRFARIGLDGMKAERERHRQQTLRSLERLPASTRQQLQAQMEAQDAAMAANLKIRATKSGTVDGQPCQWHAWSSAHGEGRACLAQASEPWAGFAKDVRAFHALLAKAVLGNGALSMPIVALAPLGRPLRIVETVRFGPRRIDSTTDYGALEPKTFPRAHFAPPAGYAQLSIAEMSGGPAPP